MAWWNSMIGIFGRSCFSRRLRGAIRFHDVIRCLRSFLAANTVPSLVPPGRLPAAPPSPAIPTEPAAAGPQAYFQPLALVGNAYSMGCLHIWRNTPDSSRDRRRRRRTSGRTFVRRPDLGHHCHSHGDGKQENHNQDKNPAATHAPVRFILLFHTRDTARFPSSRQWRISRLTPMPCAPPESIDQYDQASDIPLLSEGLIPRLAEIIPSHAGTSRNVSRD